MYLASTVARMIISEHTSTLRMMGLMISILGMSSTVPPTARAGRTIREVIQTTQDYVDCILVCDDGSTDNTLMILDSLDVDIVGMKENKGHGATLVSLFKYCKSIDADYAVTIDADGQHDPRYIPVLIEPISNGECTRASSS